MLPESVSCGLAEFMLPVMQGSALAEFLFDPVEQDDGRLMKTSPPFR
ncbi:MAG: hypothetical protein HKN42_02065 [Granulosicoccus sp.]|nr:hypothetical protein [Granulosicoccus sp.]